MKLHTPVVVLLLCASGAQAQNIGINTTGATPAASSMLDIAASDRGLLIPRVTLTATNAAAPVTTPANSLLVYNTATAGSPPNNVTPGYYYYETTSSRWLPLLSGVKGWSTTGNAGTTAGTNFIGTTDAQAFVIKTGGSAAANERMRVLATGQTVLNRATAVAGDVFSVYATGSPSALNALGDVAITGYASGDGVGVWGEANSGSGATGGAGGWFRHVSPNTPNDDFSAGVIATNTSDPLNATNGGTSFGLLATASGWPGALGGRAIGVLGNAPGPNSATGVVGTGGGTGFYYTMMGGSGASFTGDRIGSISFGLNATSGVGAIGLSNGANTIFTPTRGAGVVGIGDQYGVVGMNQQNPTNTIPANNQAATPNNNAGGYFEMDDNSGTALGWSYVATRVGGTYYKVHGTGTAGTIVKDLDDQYIGLACIETPEILFQDYGSGRLVNGRAHVVNDPRFAHQITVNEKHPLRVFVQLEGECNGVYVTNKTAESFDVVELGRGRSNVAFSYNIVANRADEVLLDGSVSRYADVRFPPAPGPAAKTKQEALQSGVPKQAFGGSKKDRP